jgi:2-oxoglutarate ferredoxin oxidoreductase subunit beta
MNEAALTKADFTSDQEIRWCPGCGDYAILAAMQRVLPSVGIRPENTVFISGIGCASRFPYYMNTYGFHTIHGRAPAIATGLKLMRPDLSVWMITGDGDGLSIGAGHLMHLLRRNVDIKVLLFNNRIYGLTKGQYSPTSEQGKVTKSTPQGSLDQPINPVAFALASGASFVARAIDVDNQGLQEVILAASQHRGTAFIEILQNCPIFNDGAFESVRDKALRSDNAVFLKNNQPVVFGKESTQGLSFDAQGGIATVDSAQAMVHDIQNPNPFAAMALASLTHPIALGVFRAIERPCYEQLLSSNSNKGATSELQTLLRGKDSWEVS